MTLRESLDAAGVRGALRHELLETFLAGVLLEDEQQTSAAFTRFLVRTFAFGVPALPRGGMQALPEQLAGRLGRPVELGCPVDAVTGGPSAAVDGPQGRLTARAVVVATDPTTAVRLVGLDPVPMKGLVTHWFSCDQPPSTSALLHLDGRRRGPAVNTAVVSNAARSYAPSGRHLVQATSLLAAGEAPPTEDDVLAQLAEIYEASTRGWELVTTHVVTEALPVQPAPLRERREVTVSPRLFVCGDHRDTASIEGALVSGRRTATAVRRELAVR